MCVNYSSIQEQCKLCIHMRYNGSTNGRYDKWCVVRPVDVWRLHYFSNKYLRITPTVGGIVTMKSKSIKIKYNSLMSIYSYSKQQLKKKLYQKYYEDVRLHFTDAQYNIIVNFKFRRINCILFFSILSIHYNIAFINNNRVEWIILNVNIGLLKGKITIFINHSLHIIGTTFIRFINKTYPINIL